MASTTLLDYPHNVSTSTYRALNLPSSILPQKPYKRKKSFCFLATVISILVIEYIAYTGVLLLPLIYPTISILGIILGVTFNLIFILTVTAYIKCVRTDPGQIPRHWAFYRGDVAKRRRYCKECNAWKPDRTHHCSSCCRCILNMDHHCPWVDNCIGFYNRKFFMQLLIYGDIGLALITLHGSIRVLENFWNQFYLISDSYQMTDIALLILICFITGISGFLFLAMVQFSAFHIGLVATNLTTIENLEFSNRSHSKYDLGIAGNCEQVFGLSWVLWWLPTHTTRSAPVGDGVRWSRQTYSCGTTVTLIYAEGFKDKMDTKSVHYFMMSCIGIMLIILGYITFRLIQVEYNRKTNFSSFMKAARVEFARPSIPVSVIQGHLQLRLTLFARFCLGDSMYKTLEDADEFVELNGQFENSWQRRLPPEAKQDFKTALLRRAVATLPRYEASKRDFQAKAQLFERRLINEDHWTCVRKDYEDICDALQLIIFDANCLEDNWGTKPDGLLQTAAVIARHEASKQQEEEMKKQASRVLEMQQLKEQKLKEQSQREEREKAEKQRRLADAAHAKLLEAETHPSLKLKKRKNIS